MKTRVNNKRFIVLVSVVTFILVLLAAVGCSPSESGSQSDSSDAPVMGVAGEFTSDENCLSCHGESYETHAATTASYGIWNPHDSIHGGYNSCVNCHERDKELTDNQCAHCHAWTPEGLTR